MGKVVGKLEVKNTNLVHFVYSWLMVLSNIPGWRPGGGQSSKYWYCQRKNRAWSFENNIEVCQTDFFPFFYQTWVNDSISWPLVDFKIKLFFFSLLILQRDARDRKCSPVPVSLCQICQILSWYWQKKLFQDYDKLFKSFKTALATEWQSWRFSVGLCLPLLGYATRRCAQGCNSSCIEEWCKLAHYCCNGGTVWDHNASRKNSVTMSAEYNVRKIYHSVSNAELKICIWGSVRSGPGLSPEWRKNS